MKVLRIAIGGLLLLTFCPPQTSQAEDKPDDVIRKMCDYYKGQQSFSVTSDMDIAIHAQGMNNKSHSTVSFLFDRPNRVALKGKGSPGLTVVCDGKNIYELVTALKKYTKKEAPKTLTSLAQDRLLSIGAPGTTNFAVYFMGDEPKKLMLTGVTASKDLGTTKLDGQSARHLTFSRDDMDLEVWIADGKEPLLLRVDFDLSKMLKKSGAFKGKDVKITAIQRFKDWKFDVKPTPKDFSFTAPKNCKEVPNLFGRGEDEEEELSPLLGKAAPPVDLERFGGKRVRLADHVGKEVVMLDMWATWCGPCRAELPHLIAVAKEFESKGVVLYAINLREPKKKIEEFLKKEKLKMTIGLDTKGKVGEAYGAHAIPLLVLVDKKGIVQSVHVGYSPDIEKTLRKELNGILGGEDLAAVTIAEHQKKVAQKDKAKAKAKAKDKEKNKDKDKKATTETTAR
jgi:thiol-disulfide isomerase/thioredoxin